MIPVDALIRQFTHMPAILEIGGQPLLLFSAAARGDRWRSYYSPLNDLSHAQLIPTTTPPDGSECSPDGYVDAAGEVNLSITQDYRLMRYCGATLDALTPVQDYGPCRAGTVLPNGSYLLWEDAAQALLLRTAAGGIARIMTLEQLGFEPYTLITRITFMCEDPDKLIFTGATRAQRVRSVLFSLDMGRAWEITAQGSPVYKCALYRGELLYAVKGGAIFEDRYLARTRAFDLIPV